MSQTRENTALISAADQQPGDHFSLSVFQSGPDAITTRYDAEILLSMLQILLNNNHMQYTILSAQKDSVKNQATGIMDSYSNQAQTVFFQGLGTLIGSLVDSAVIIGGNKFYANKETQEANFCEETTANISKFRSTIKTTPLDTERTLQIPSASANPPPPVPVSDTPCQVAQKLKDNTANLTLPQKSIQASLETELMANTPENGAPEVLEGTNPYTPFTSKYCTTTCQETLTRQINAMPDPERQQVLDNLNQMCTKLSDRQKQCNQNASTASMQSTQYGSALQNALSGGMQAWSSGYKTLEGMADVQKTINQFVTELINAVAQTSGKGFDSAVQQLQAILQREMAMAQANSVRG